MSFSELEREQFNSLQERIKPLLLGVEKRIVLWVIADLLYFIATLPSMPPIERSAVSSALREIANLIDGSN